MPKTKSTFEFFPKEKNARLQDAFIYWLLFGTFGVHQFYLGNKKRAYYLLVTCGFSPLLVLLIPEILPFLKVFFGLKLSLVLVLFGYALGVPILLWDFVTLLMQVPNKNGQINL